MADQHAVKVTADTEDGNQKENKADPDSAADKADGKCRVGAPQSVKDGGECSGQIQERTDPTEDYDKGPCQAVVKNKLSDKPAGQ